ncbi:MAG: murein hydrolase activator EnvC [Vicinamibacterales bacterium]
MSKRTPRAWRMVVLAAALGHAAAAGAQGTPGQVPPGDPLPVPPAAAAPPAAPLSAEAAAALTQRATDRIRALQRESDQLAAQSRTVLGQLRQLEVTQALRTEELGTVTARLTAVNEKVAASESRVAELERQRVARTPALEARLEALYKRGGTDGYVRLLLQTMEGRDLARASRGVVALARVEELRIAAHRKLLTEEQAARDQLASEQRQVARLQAETANLEAEARRAVTARTRLLDDLDKRRELTAQYVGELDQARQRLQSTLGDLPAGGAVDLPIRPFHGDLPWPIRGALLTRFGRAPSSFGTAIQRNGIEIGTPLGSPVRAVHGGTVAYAAPFTGFGLLVILDHGDNAFSVYGHLSSTALQPGAVVSRDEVIGTSGTTPDGQPAAYFELRIDGRPVNPVQWLKPVP